MHKFMRDDEILKTRALAGQVGRKRYNAGF